MFAQRKTAEPQVSYVTREKGIADGSQFIRIGHLIIHRLNIDIHHFTGYSIYLAEEIIIRYERRYIAAFINAVDKIIGFFLHALNHSPERVCRRGGTLGRQGGDERRNLTQHQLAHPENMFSGSHGDICLVKIEHSPFACVDIVMQVRGVLPVPHQLFSAFTQVAYCGRREREVLSCLNILDLDV